MLLFAICILMNALIGVIFKIFDRYQVNLLPAIVVNYFVCVLTSMVATQSITVDASTPSQGYFIYALALGLLFVIIFNLYGRSVAGFGIAVSTIFQKMSLIAPTLVGILYFSEHLSLVKGGGIALAIAAILLITGFFHRKKQAAHDWKDWLIPIAVLAGSCVIDTGLLLIDKLGIAENGDVRFVATLFFCVGLAGLALLLPQLISGKQRIAWRDVWAGIGLGIPNFFSIYLIMLLLARGWEGSIVFPVLNVGILAVAAVFGYLLFSEKLTSEKLGGLALSILAIIMIAYG